MLYTYVDDAKGLSAAVERSHAAGVIGLDTEFMRQRTYHAMPSLYQVQAGDQCYLIDVLAVKDVTAFRDLLSAPDVVKVMHGSGADLDLFASHLQVLPENMFDTQIAAALVGFRYTISYQDLLTDMLGVAIEKAAARSNWLRRPLSEKQLDYAAGDVCYLLPLYRLLNARLQALGRMDWFTEEMAALRLADDPAEQYRRHASIWKLEGAALLRFKLLYQWREEVARVQDKPRNWVIPDTLLYEFAKRPEPDAVLTPHPKIKRLHARKMLDISTGSDKMPRSAWPPPADRPLQQAERTLLNVLRGEVRHAAQAENLPEVLLGSRKMLTQLIVAGRRGDPLPALFCGWRLQVLKPSFMQQAMVGSASCYHHETQA